MLAIGNFQLLLILFVLIVFIALPIGIIVYFKRKK